MPRPLYNIQKADYSNTNRLGYLLFFLRIRISETLKCLKSKLASIQISDISIFWTSKSQTSTVHHVSCSRYLIVLKTGLEAMRSGEPVDYQRFYQQQSDVCMLRLFDSFAESAPQLVFHLYVMILRSYWPIEQVIS